MKRIIVLFITLLFTLLIVGCSAEGSDFMSSGPRGESDDYDDVGGEGNQGPQAGQITASEWRDLENYDFYLSLFEEDQNKNQGIFKEFLNKGYFNTLNMVTVTVKNEEEVLPGAKVALYNDSNKIICQAVSNVLGVAYLFPKPDQLEQITSIKVEHDGKFIEKEYEYISENNSITIEIDSENNKQDVIEIMFVIDATGSMGDELQYLKSEIKNVITQIDTKHPNTTIKLALLFYRDNGDDYVTRYFDFTTNIELQKQNISNQYADGGGDYPEAVDIALDEAVSKNWSSGNTTKLLFHVLDAPPHDTQQNMSKFYNAINKASEKGIRMIPVASSGINKYTEYLLRNEAMMSGGTYVFITNDSGIGNDHIEASVGEVPVEYLNNLLIRLVSEFHTGIPGEKTPYNKK